MSDCESQLEAAGIHPSIMIDCSHANSNKDPANQTRVIDDVAEQILDGNQSIIGLMIESHLNWGNQSIPKDVAELEYGCQSPMHASIGKRPNRPLSPYPTN